VLPELNGVAGVVAAGSKHLVEPVFGQVIACDVEEFGREPVLHDGHGHVVSEPHPVEAERRGVNLDRELFGEPGIGQPVLEGQEVGGWLLGGVGQVVEKAGELHAPGDQSVHDLGTDAPAAPKAENVFKSAWLPAPPLGSVPAMLRTLKIIGGAVGAMLRSP